MLLSNYTSDYFEIIGDALEDLRENDNSIDSEIVSIPKKQFMNLYDSLCQLKDRMEIKVASYADVTCFLENLEEAMTKYI